jgi:hypothetical protein
VGAVLERYDHWSSGKPIKRWRSMLPTDDEGVLPKALDCAGDHAFVVSVKPVDGVAGTVHVLRLSDGVKVGVIRPGPEVGHLSGWVDIPFAISALKRTTGEYLVLVEEDFRGKSILYRWQPGK